MLGGGGDGGRPGRGPAPEARSGWGLIITCKCSGRAGWARGLIIACGYSASLLHIVSLLWNEVENAKYNIIFQHF